MFIRDLPAVVPTPEQTRRYNRDRVSAVCLELRQMEDDRKLAQGYWAKRLDDGITDTREYLDAIAKRNRREFVVIQGDRP